MTMIKEDLELEYKEFVKQYAINPICDYTISFSYKGNYFQFDFVDVPKNKDGTVAYDFISYNEKWSKIVNRIHFKSLKEALAKTIIDGKSFEEIYNCEDSELIDIS